jgi:gluconokinase
MIADVLCHPVIPCLESEATSRGAALVALERIGAIRDIGDPAPKLGDDVRPDESKKEIYLAALQKQRWLYSKLLEDGAP